MKDVLSSVKTRWRCPTSQGSYSTTLFTITTSLTSLGTTPLSQTVSHLNHNSLWPHPTVNPQVFCMQWPSSGIPEQCFVRFVSWLLTNHYWCSFAETCNRNSNLRFTSGASCHLEPPAVLAAPHSRCKNTLKLWTKERNWHDPNFPLEINEAWSSWERKLLASLSIPQIYVPWEAATEAIVHSSLSSSNRQCGPGNIHSFWAWSQPCCHNTPH